MTRSGGGGHVRATRCKRKTCYVHFCRTSNEWECSLHGECAGPRAPMGDNMGDSATRSTTYPPDRTRSDLH